MFKTKLENGNFDQSTHGLIAAARKVDLWIAVVFDQCLQRDKGLRERSYITCVFSVFVLDMPFTLLCILLKIIFRTRHSQDVRW